ncbi:MAG: hypothetical protein COB02_15210 [Candidatus Cloacimonadota bacterium]|nr:MAG: hypothetical protein COB02_15210 [Candidatus Cloacimonadota bacterium]
MQKNLLLIFLLLSTLSFANKLRKERHRDSQYNDYMDSYEGEFNPLKYTLVSYRGNKQANNGKEKLSDGDLSGRNGGILGNFLIEVSPEQVKGLNQALAIATGTGLSNTALQSSSDLNSHYKPSGIRLKLSKRFLSHGRYKQSLSLEMHKSDSKVIAPKSGTGLEMSNGNKVTSLTGTMDNIFWNLDWTMTKSIRQHSRYSFSFIGGLRIIDFAIKSNVVGIQNIPSNVANNLQRAESNYHLRNIGLGPFLGFIADTPISNKVRVSLKGLQYQIASKGEAKLRQIDQSASGKDIVNTQTREVKNTGFPMSEFSFDMNFFFDHSTRLNLGYSYTHINLYNITSFSNIRFQDITMHGPKASLNFHF